MSLSIQATAGIVSFIVGALVVAVVIFLILTSVGEGDENAAKAKVYKVRDRYFIGLLLVAAVALTFTLRALPYDNPETYDKEEITVVGVVGMQWLWRMDEGPLPEKPEEFMGGNEITVKANERIQFEVTAIDVNHGFGIYNDKGQLLTQTQVMPGAINRLNYTFEKGEYEVLCMEYCGLPHGIMVGKIIVE